MPSFEHEALVQLLAQTPKLLVELLREQLGDLLPEDATVSLGADTLRAAAPVEVRADAVLVFRGRNGRLALIVEVQLAVVTEKRAVWPVYVSLVHRDLECPTLLVILALDSVVARWCAEPVRLSPFFVLQPLVIGPDQLPLALEPTFARANPELAVLAAVAHGERAPPNQAAALAEVALLALDEADLVDDHRAADYADLVLAALGHAAYRLLEEKMKARSEGNPYRSKFARDLYDLGAAEGEARGRMEGEARGEARALLEVLAARGIAVDDAFVERVRACTDIAQLTVWIRRAVTANALQDVFDA
jgi:hypothetical protein